MSTIYAKPGENFNAVLRGAPAGQVGTMGVSILHKGNGAVVVARTTEGIVEVPAESGNYETNLKAPVAGKYLVFWDNGEITPGTTAADDLISTPNPPVEIEPAYDVETDVGLVRLLISDIGGKDGASFIFADKEIEVLIARRESLELAAATLLRSIAGNEAMVSKRIEFLELKTDGPAVSKALRELATDLEQTSDDDAMFEIIQMNVDMFSRRDLILNRLKREG